MGRCPMDIKGKCQKTSELVRLSPPKEDTRCLELRDPRIQENSSICAGTVGHYPASENGVPIDHPSSGPWIAERPMPDIEQLGRDYTLQ